MARKPRDHKAEYARRIERNLAKGYTRSQARGHAGKGQLPIRPTVDPKHKANYDALLARIIKNAETPSDLAKLKELLKLSLKTNFARREKVSEDPTPFDLLLLSLSDTGPGDFSGGSDESVALMDQFQERMWDSRISLLPENVINDLGLDTFEDLL